MNAQKTTVDWLRFRFQADPRDGLEALKPMFGDLAHLLRFEALPKGILGFQRALSVQLADMTLGRMDFGGDSQRGWVRVDISGKGCEWVRNWQASEEVEALPSAQIRRLDIALTTWDDEVGHDAVVQAHKQGRFVTRGRPPELSQILNSNPRAGRTCNVGTREKSDKFFRGYEKGFELAGKMPFGEVTHINGKAVEGIYRCEVELKACSTDIPWDVIERRDQYFAGAYPFCAEVLPGVEADILMRRPDRAPTMELAAALGHMKAQWGPTLYTALRAYHGDMTAVWDKVVGDHHSQPLLEAGVLLVDHE